MGRVLLVKLVIIELKYRVAVVDFFMVFLFAVVDLEVFELVFVSVKFFEVDGMGLPFADKVFFVCRAL